MKRIKCQTAIDCPKRRRLYDRVFSARVSELMYTLLIWLMLETFNSVYSSYFFTMTLIPLEDAAACSCNILTWWWSPNAADQHQGAFLLNIYISRIISSLFLLFISKESQGYNTIYLMSLTLIDDINVTGLAPYIYRWPPIVLYSVHGIYIK